MVRATSALQTKNHNARGFTLIELLVVFAVIATLAAIAAFGIRYATAAARDAKRASIMHDLQFAMELYSIRNQHYFNNPNTFCANVTALVSGSYLDVTPVDPKTQTAICTGAGDGNPTVGGAMYNYEATPSSDMAISYLLKLSKESGGYLEFYSSK